MSEEDRPKRRRVSGPKIRLPKYRVSDRIKEFERSRGRLSIDTFQNFSLNLGLGTNNALSDSTYGFLPITRDRTLLEWIYRGSWLAGVAIDVIAQDMTRAGIKITSSMSPSEITRLESAANYYGIWSAISDVIAWGRLYGGAIGVVMIEGQDPRTPLRIDTIGPGQFQGIMVFDRWMVEPDLERMVRGPGDDSLVPATYWVVASGSGISFEGMRIHHSRVFRHEGVRLPYWQRVMENMWGISVLERLYDRLIAFDSATNGAAQLIYKSYLRTFYVENLREVAAAGGIALENLQKQIELMRRYQGIEGITLVDSKDKFEGQASAATSFSGIAEALIHFGQQLSGALQIPLVRLFGQSPVGLNSTGESDFRNYYDGIRQRQERELRPAVSMIYRVMAKSIGIDLPPDFNFTFTPLWQMQESDRAEVAQKAVQAVTEARDAGLISQRTAVKELKSVGESVGIFSTISEEDIEQADPNLMPPVSGVTPEGLPLNPEGIPVSGTGAPLVGGSGEVVGGPGPEDSMPEFSSYPILQGAPIGAGGRDPSVIGLGEAPRNEVSAGGGPGGLGSPVNTSVPPEERARAFRVYTNTSARTQEARLVDFQGIPVYVETFRGQKRRDDWPELAADYGYIRMTGSPEGKGEGLDVFLGPYGRSSLVVVIDTVDPVTGAFDEHKIMLGFADRREAIKAFTSSYEDGAARIGRVWQTTVSDLRKQIERGGWRAPDRVGQVR